MTDQGQAPVPPPKDASAASSFDLSNVSGVVRTGLVRGRQRLKSENKSVDKQAGPVGRIIGDKEHQAGNIATIAIGGLLLITGIAVIGLLILAGRKSTLPESAEDVKTIILALIALIGTILGYLFGRASR